MSDSNSVTVSRPATPGINFMESIKWGVTTTFKKPGIWILGSIIYLAVVLFFSLASSLLSTVDNPDATTSIWSTAVNVIACILIILVTPFILRLAIHQVDENENISWKFVKKDTHFATTIAVLATIGLVVGVVLSLFTLIIIATIPESSNPEDVNGAVALALLAVILASAIISVLVTPLYTLMQWFAAEGRTGYRDSFVAGFQAGRINYWSLLGFQIVASVLGALFIVCTLGIGTIIYVPAVYLAEAHIYRQIAPQTKEEIEDADTNTNSPATEINVVEEG